MNDSVAVYFNCFSEPINVSSILAQFTLFGHEFTIRWYGAIIAFGFLLAVLFGGRMAYKWKISIDKMLDVLIYGTIFAIIGARLYYCIFKWDSYKDNPLDVFAIWEGGLAIYGGIIGGIAAAYIVCKIRKMNFWNLMDMVAMSLLIGQGIGRWGNFANQEAFGTNTDLPLGMWSSKVSTYISAHMSDLRQTALLCTRIRRYTRHFFMSLFVVCSAFLCFLQYAKKPDFSADKFFFATVFGTALKEPLSRA